MRALPIAGFHFEPVAVFPAAAAILGQSLLPAFVGLIANRFGLEIIGPALLVAAITLLILFKALAARSLYSEISSQTTRSKPIATTAKARSRNSVLYRSSNSRR